MFNRNSSGIGFSGGEGGGGEKNCLQLFRTNSQLMQVATTLADEMHIGE